MNDLSSTVSIQKAGVSVDVYIDPFNKRIRVDHYLGNPASVLEVADELVKQYKVSKLIIKARREQYTFFVEHGFQPEAMIDGYFLGSDMFFFCKYFELNRSNNEHMITESDIVTSVQQLQQSPEVIQPPQEYKLVKVTPNQSGSLADLYKEVFQVYPTPLHDPKYIDKTLEEGTIYYAFLYNNRVISAASAEINLNFRNAELTDCATLKEFRKFGLMKIILEELEADLFDQGIYCSYSIARALSFGMNAVLHQLGYRYRGRLINNCYIYDKLEDMNVWVKEFSVSKQ